MKTSVLILDKEFNQKSDSIFFAKVENDGLFSLSYSKTVYNIFDSDFPLVTLGDLCDLYQPKTITQIKLEDSRNEFSGPIDDDY